VTIVKSIRTGWHAYSVGRSPASRLALPLNPSRGGSVLVSEGGQFFLSLDIMRRRRSLGVAKKTTTARTQSVHGAAMTRAEPTCTGTRNRYLRDRAHDRALRRRSLRRVEGGEASAGQALTGEWVRLRPVRRSGLLRHRHGERGMETVAPGIRWMWANSLAPPRCFRRPLGHVVPQPQSTGTGR